MEIAICNTTESFYMIWRCLHETWNELNLKWTAASSSKKNKNKINLFTLLSVAGGKRWNLVSGMVAVKQPVKICKQNRAIYRDENVGGNNRDTTVIKEVLRWTNATTNKNAKHLKIWHKTWIQWNEFDYLCCRFQIIVRPEAITLT